MTTRIGIHGFGRTGRQVFRAITQDHGRELEIVSAIVAGLSNREMASQFAISEQTVKHHLTRIYDKLGVSNRLELALYAIQRRLVDETGP